MSSTDKTLMYPEARMHLRQLGFDQTEQTIDELVEGDYLREYSTVVEFIDSTDDTVFHESIATKFNNPAFNFTGFMMVIYKSVLAHQFVFFDINGEYNLAVSYHKENGWGLLRDLSGLDQCNLNNPNNYVNISLRKSGAVKYLKVAGYINSQFNANSDYTLATIGSNERNVFMPVGNTYYQNLYVTPDVVGRIQITSDYKIMFMPYTTMPKGTGMNLNISYI